ncbi:TetR/AcrR family transcriptional regulator [Desulfovibrio ferrophilus]|uniref:Regulatory protein TetR n=1 Tax=Desulfovibrio ferrophilus TaxID=241368 RepID=A0A2Z6AVY3_9BACT|nr:hypothetical protein [Desulfovibrio ferrophilus]BBD07335.1 regulatory protein TetR [Desulfovibrio ferrophilus]
MPARTVISLTAPQELRDRILEATGEVISKRGPCKVTLSAIAIQAKVDEALITRLFGGLAHVLDDFAMSDRFWPPISELAGGDPQELSKRPLGDQMSVFFKNYLRALRRRPWTLAVMAEEGRQVCLLTHALAYIRERRALEFFEEILGDDPPPDIDLPAVILLMALAVSRTGILSTRLKSIGGVDLESDAGWERIERTIELMLTRALSES